MWRAVAQGRGDDQVVGKVDLLRGVKGIDAVEVADHDWQRDDRHYPESKPLRKHGIWR